jgi:uncharacterized protein
MRVMITGASGMLGQELVRHFTSRGDAVTAIGRGGGGASRAVTRVRWDPAAGELDPALLEGHDAAIHLAGESIAGVWTPDRKRRILESRRDGTGLLSRTLAALATPPRVLLSASGVGIYGAREEPVDESMPIGSGFLAEVGRVWEDSTQPAADAGIRVVNMRLGNVLAPHGGFLQALLPLFRLGLGASFGDGRTWYPWIALSELPGIVDHLIATETLAGPVNVVAPEAARNEEMTQAIAGALKRPSFLKVPAFALKLAPGGMGEELLLSGARVVPAKLLASGYQFREPRLRPALDAMLR